MNYIVLYLGISIIIAYITWVVIKLIAVEEMENE